MRAAPSPARRHFAGVIIPMNDQESKRVLRVWLALGLCCAVAACGGGLPELLAYGPDAKPVRMTSPTRARAAEPAAAAKNNTNDASCGLNGAQGIQTEVLRRVNALRAAGAVCGGTTYGAARPLSWNSRLVTAARGHSIDMAQHNYFSHGRADGKTLAQRVRAAGSSFSAVGENIAAGQPSVASVMAGWIDSPGHCQNLMNPRFRDIGVACVRNDGAAYRRYWTMDLGGT